MAWQDTDIGGFIGKQPAAPTAPAAPVATGPIGGGATAPDFFAPLGNASSEQLSGALQVNPQSPQTSSAAISGLGSGGSGYSAPSAPNFSFDTDPRVALAKALENQGIGQLDAWLKSAREQAIIQSGDPALAGMAGFGLDPQAGVFAQQNYLSGNADLARVDRAKKMARQQIINRLAARGLLRSGDLGYLQGESNMDFGNQEYDVRQNILGKLAQYMRDYLERKQSLKQSTLGAYQDAYDRADLNSYYGGTADGPVDTGRAPVFTPRDRLRWER